MAKADEIYCFDKKSAAHPVLHILISLLLSMNMSTVKIMEKPEVFSLLSVLRVLSEGHLRCDI